MSCAALRPSPLAGVQPWVGTRGGGRRQTGSQRASERGSGGGGSRARARASKPSQGSEASERGGRAGERGASGEAAVCRGGRCRQQKIAGRQAGQGQSRREGRGDEEARCAAGRADRSASRQQARRGRAAVCWLGLKGGRRGGGLLKAPASACLAALAA